MHNKGMSLVLTFARDTVPCKVPINELFVFSAIYKTYIIRLRQLEECKQ